MKRRMSAALALLIALVALAGCAGKNEGEGKPSEPSVKAENSTELSSNAKLEEVTLKIMIPASMKLPAAANRGEPNRVPSAAMASRPKPCTS